MGMKTQRQGQIGVNVVERIVLTEWKSRWQPLDSQNDDAVDGLIFLERGGEMTGQVIFVQVKCFKKKASIDGGFRLPIDSKKLDRNMQAWRRVVGAAILVFVDPVSLKARWVDVRDPQARTAAQVIVPENQIFDAGAKRKVALLTGNLHRDLLLRHVETVSEDFPHLRGNQLLKSSSRLVLPKASRRQAENRRNGTDRHVRSALLASHFPSRPTQACQVSVIRALGLYHEDIGNDFAQRVHTISF